MMMLLELNDVMKIIGDQCVKLMMWTDKVSEGGDESIKKGAAEMKTIINAYTGLICRAIEEAENERVCSMLEGMEKYEFKTDEEGERMTPCEQMTLGMMAAYCVALRIMETSPSLDEAYRRMKNVWRETRRVFDGEESE